MKTIEVISAATTQF